MKILTIEQAEQYLYEEKIKICQKASKKLLQESANVPIVKEIIIQLITALNQFVMENTSILSIDYKKVFNDFHMWLCGQYSLAMEPLKSMLASMIKAQYDQQKSINETLKLAQEEINQGKQLYIGGNHAQKRQTKPKAPTKRRRRL